MVSVLGVRVFVFSIREHRFCCCRG